MVLKESFGYITSDKNRHFTDALVNGASEYENIQFDTKANRYSAAVASSYEAGAAKCFITSVLLTAATNHSFTVSFWTRRAAYQAMAATPYDNALLGWVHLDSKEAWQVTGSEFHYATAFQAIPYLDEDNLNELHVGVMNRSTTTKAALGSGNLPAGVFQQYITLRVGYVRSV